MLPRPLLAALFLAVPLSAQVPATTQTAPPHGYTQIIPLWPPNHIPLSQGTTDGDIPKLFTYPASGPGPHPAVIVLPGGGYTHLAIEKEGAEAAIFLAAHGVSAFVLQYRLSPAYRFPAPMLDAARAVRYVRANAATLNIDPNRLGTWGFSAGGHLSAYLASMPPIPPPAPTASPVTPDPIDAVSSRPDFTILAYGRFTLDPSLPRPGITTTADTMEKVLNATTAQLEILPHINANNPPAFLYSTSGDQTVDARNATAFYNALKALHIPAELHIFELGVHGTGLGTEPKSPPEIAIWPLLLAHWMQQNNWMPTQP